MIEKLAPLGIKSVGEHCGKAVNTEIGSAESRRGAIERP
jgi:hypothetical protein